MNIAIVGSGSQCLYLLDFIKNHTFRTFIPKIVAIADTDEREAAALREKKSELFITRDYNDFFEREDINLIVELAGDMDIYNDIIKKKKKTVRAIAHTTARLFWEIARASGKEQEARLKLSKTRSLYEAVVNELIQEDVMVISTDYHISDVNDALLKKLGLKRTETIGRFCYEITHHQDRPCSGENHPCPLKTAIKTRLPGETTHIHLDRDGNEIHYSITCYPVIENGEITGVIELSRDITKDIKRQKTIMQQEKLISIGRLSAGVAHEINNPLTTIMTSAMLLLEDIEPDDPIAGELSTISKESLRCRKIVQSLLDFARQTEPMKKLININEVVTDSIFLTRKQAQFNDLTLTAKPGQGMPKTYADKDQIQQSIINLVLNAIEATTAGGGILLTTEYNKKTSELRINVNDTGCGIPPENIDKIFDPFFTTRDNGTGLGLAITHGIIEQHGGRMEVESIPGKGARFTIILPITRQEDSNAR